MKETARVCVLYPAAIALVAALTTSLPPLGAHKTLWFVIIHQGLMFGLWFPGSLVPYIKGRMRVRDELS